MTCPDVFFREPNCLLLLSFRCHARFAVPFSWQQSRAWQPAPNLIRGRTLVRSFRYAASRAKRNISPLTSFRNKRTLSVFIFHSAFIYKQSSVTLIRLEFDSAYQKISLMRMRPFGARFKALFSYINPIDNKSIPCYLKLHPTKKAAKFSLLFSLQTK